MTRGIITAAMISAVLIAVAWLRRCPSLSAHDDCWRPWRDVRCDRLSAEATMLRAAGR